MSNKPSRHKLQRATLVRAPTAHSDVKGWDNPGTAHNDQINLFMYSVNSSTGIFHTMLVWEVPGESASCTRHQHFRGYHVTMTVQCIDFFGSLVLVCQSSDLDSQIPGRASNLNLRTVRLE